MHQHIDRAIVWPPFLFRATVRFLKYGVALVSDAVCLVLTVVLSFVYFGIGMVSVVLFNTNL